MLAGTGSDVGKSLIAAGLCRIFLQDGYHPAPFKAQNMALNSCATPDGAEIGRAQGVQAEAAGIAPTTDMNPILLKPSGNHTSQVVLNGRPAGNCSAFDYFRKRGREHLRAEAHAAFDRLKARYNPIVMEGAGSISEINLRDSDIVNMSMAAYADADVILVADIDRGGVFASAYGSVMLQSEEDRKRIKGIIINKFRGDLRLFEEGRLMMEQICGVPVLGVVPFATHFHIDEEDSVALSAKKDSLDDTKINIAVVRLPHISNYTDFNQLEAHPRINLFYTANPRLIAEADITIIPGTKATMADLKEIRKNGVADAILDAARRGKTVVGICGGYQMLGRRILDPKSVESDISEMAGLGLLPVVTTLTAGKVTRQTNFHFLSSANNSEGYEIHMGQTERDGGKPVNILADGTEEGCMASEGRCLGTYLHGIFDNPEPIDWLLTPFTEACAPKIDYKEYKEEQYDLLADHLRRYIDIDKLYEIIGND